MDKRNSNKPWRRLLVLLLIVGAVIGIGFSIIAAISNNSGGDLATDWSRQLSEDKTTPQSPAAQSEEKLTETITVNAYPLKDDANASSAPKSPSLIKQSPSASPVKPKKVTEDSPTRVKVTPRPVTSPTQGSQVANPEVSVSAAPDQKSPTEGYIRPQVSFMGVTSCSRTNDGWVLTISWKVTGGNFIALFYGDRSGLKTPGDTWVISVKEELSTSIVPTGNHIFRTEGDVLEFLPMNGRGDIIDVIRFPDRTTADINGFCR